MKRRSDAIIGAIGGDIIGSAYEFEEREVKTLKCSRTAVVLRMILY